MSNKAGVRQQIMICVARDSSVKEIDQMIIKHKEAAMIQKRVQSSVRQGDIVLVNFGREVKGGRNLCGKRPVYVMNKQSNNRTNGAFMAIPLFRTVSRDSAGGDVEITPADCHGLRYSQYAQPMNIQKVRKGRIMKKIGHVGEGVHERILAAMWDQVDSYKEGLLS